MQDKRIVDEAKQAEHPLMLLKLVAHNLGEAGLHLAGDVAADVCTTPPST